MKHKKLLKMAAQSNHNVQQSNDKNLKSRPNYVQIYLYIYKYRETPARLHSPAKCTVCGGDI